jgi:hypothetical protein
LPCSFASSLVNNPNSLSPAPTILPPQQSRVLFGIPSPKPSTIQRTQLLVPSAYPHPTVPRAGPRSRPQFPHGGITSRKRAQPVTTRRSLWVRDGQGMACRHRRKH